MEIINRANNGYYAIDISTRLFSSPATSRPCAAEGSGISYYFSASAWSKIPVLKYRILEIHVTFPEGPEGSGRRFASPANPDLGWPPADRNARTGISKRMEKDTNMTYATDIPAANTDDHQASLGRRAALFNIGLATLAAFAAPAMLTLSEAEARGRGGNGKSGRGAGRRGNHLGRRQAGEKDCIADNGYCDAE